jgi:hypothetical protein
MVKRKRGDIMKKFLICVVLLSAFFAPARAECAEEKFKTYVNARFGYSLSYPDIFEPETESENGDGAEFSSQDGEYTLTVWGGYNVLGQDGNALLEERRESVAHIVPDSERSGAELYSIEYSDDGGQDGVEHIFHEYVNVNADLTAGFILRYPKEEEKRFAGIKDAMETSLKLTKP